MLGLAGCSQPNPVAECTTAADCTQGTGGTCLGANCAYADPTCGGGLRYGANAGQGLARLCVAPACGPAQTVCGTGDAAACSSTQSDPANCGSCGMACKSGQYCMAGTCTAECVLTACPSGACVDVMSDWSNCGTCGTACTVGQQCLAGVCQAPCPTGLSACGGKCVDAMTDAKNCGACGTVCSATTPLCTAGTCGTTCGSATTCTPTGSPAYCADVKIDPANCGSCGTSCPSGELCSSGKCSAACAAGSTYCIPSGASVGTCVDLMSDDRNCGACNGACAVGQACMSGVCKATCPAGQSVCSLDAGASLCANLMTDDRNCGVCGTVCAPGNTCVSGMCTPVCPAGSMLCGATDAGTPLCVDISTDNANCGACGVACSGGQVCDGTGHCAPNCSTGFTSCGGNCTNTMTDPQNCGGCYTGATGGGVRCLDGEACSGGTCGCPTDETLCTPATGPTFCTDLTGDPMNCGTCGNVCPAGAGLPESCVAGACVEDCPAGQALCGGTCIADVDNHDFCGSTCNLCAPGSGCQGTSCVPPIAYWKFDSKDGTDSTGNGYTGSFTGATTFPAGYSNFGMEVTANAGYMQAAKNMPLNGSSFTVEAWALATTAWPTTGVIPDAPIFTEGNASSLDAYLHCVVRSGKPYFGFYSDDLAGKTALPAGTWVHLAWVFDASTNTKLIYVNGVFDSMKGSNALNVSSSAVPAVGYANFTSGMEYANGVIIDEVRVFDYARTAADLLEDATLAAHYNFDQTPQTLDDGPNHLDLADSGGSFPPAKYGNGLLSKVVGPFPQASSFAALDNSLMPWTIEAWVNPATGATPSGTLVHVSPVSAGTGAGCYSPLALNATGQPVATVVTNSSGGNAQAGAGFGIATGIWTHLAATWSPTNGLRLYVNGVWVAANAGATTYYGSGAAAPDFVTLGSSLGSGCPGAQGPYSGDLDDVRIYSAERTAAQIAADALIP
jgi:hypothetical protein